MDLACDINETVKMIDDFYKLSFHEQERKCACVPGDPTMFDKYSKVFYFTNELIKGYYKNFNYDGNILTVAGSGDHLLHSILMDCKDVVMFDINRLTYYYIALKIAAIKELSLSEFKDYFTFDGDPGLPSMSYKLFRKFECHLDDDVKEFWNVMYEKYKIGCDEDRTLEEKFYFQRSFFFLNGDYYFNDYFEESLFLKLRKNLNKSRNIEFFNTELLSLDDTILNREYSSIFLSNILDCIVDFDDFKRIFLNKYVPILNCNGSIMYNYSWDSDNSKFYVGDKFSDISISSEKAYIYSKKI